VARAHSSRLPVVVGAVVLPALVVASIGATGTGAIDPVAEMAALAHEFGAWLHVDAAWAGVAAVCPELRWVLDGVQDADSFCTNPHKWLLTTFDCDTFWVADRAALVGALSILPEYLRNHATESGSVIDYRDWQVPLGRRFRALKLWAVIRWYGAEGLRAHIRGHVELAQRFAAHVEATRAAMERVNASGAAYLTHTVLDGRIVLRLAVGSPKTEDRHVDAVYEALVAGP